MNRARIVSLVAFVYFFLFLVGCIFFAKDAGAQESDYAELVKRVESRFGPRPPTVLREMNEQQRAAFVRISKAHPMALCSGDVYRTACRDVGVDVVDMDPEVIVSAVCYVEMEPVLIRAGR